MGQPVALGRSPRVQIAEQVPHPPQVPQRGRRPRAGGAGQVGLERRWAGVGEPGEHPAHVGHQLRQLRRTAGLGEVEREVVPHETRLGLVPPAPVPVGQQPVDLGAPRAQVGAEPIPHRVVHDQRRAVRIRVPQGDQGQAGERPAHPLRLVAPQPRGGRPQQVRRLHRDLRVRGEDAQLGEPVAQLGRQRLGGEADRRRQDPGPAAGAAGAVRPGPLQPVRGAPRGGVHRRSAGHVGGEAGVAERERQRQAAGRRGEPGPQRRIDRRQPAREDLAGRRLVERAHLNPPVTRRRQAGIGRGHQQPHLPGEHLKRLELRGRGHVVGDEQHRPVPEQLVGEVPGERPRVGGRPVHREGREQPAAARGPRPGASRNMP